MTNEEGFLFVFFLALFFYAGVFFGRVLGKKKLNQLEKDNGFLRKFTYQPFCRMLTVPSKKNPFFIYQVVPMDGVTPGSFGIISSAADTKEAMKILDEEFKESFNGQFKKHLSAPLALLDNKAVPPVRKDL